ncbi:hypothetical protein [Streptomyces inhibens]|uniref:hypothetical protein n=1 Tax=Streptomyces inhibens TaxID=2293571 RepID=UPI001EE75EEA|nr:hypothetical protein [Streptomyces inhibens]UKY47766.1 hypothetical protein KI385_02225 [Streptomyces inhibens]
MSERLGPLERLDDRWVIGDPQRQGGAYLEFGAEGAHHRVTASKGQFVPWSRFMTLRLLVTTGRWSSSKTFGVLTALRPGVVPASGSGLRATLRHPYEDWTAPFSHHDRCYTWSEVLLAGELLRQTVEAGAAQRLGDPRWLEDAVGQLSPLRARTYRAARAAVAQLRKA